MEIEHLTFSNAPERVGPFSHAVKAGDFLFVTGQMPTQKNDKTNYSKAKQIHDSLIKCKIDVLLDDTEEHLSAKFKKFDLIGVPYQIILGNKSNNDKLEFKEINGKTENLSLDEIINKLQKNRISN